jgi:NAD-dependent malate dehydrogenase
MLGRDQEVILHLLEIEAAIQKAEAVAMELRDCAFPLLKEIVVTSDERTAFTNVEYVIFVGAFPRKQGMERKDMIEINAKIFSGQGKILDEVAKKNVKVLVVGNPANTNCLITATAAPSLSKSNFSALTRLDHNRAHSQVAEKANAPIPDVKNVCIWGNHSSTQFPDVAHAKIQGKPATEVLKDDAWVQREFITTVQQRGATVINKRGLSSAFSAAKAIVDHMHDWVHGTKDGEFVSMGVYSDGSYGVPAGLIYSFPVTIKDGQAKIVQGLPVSDFAKKLMDGTTKELQEEKDVAFKIVGF